MCFFSLLWGLLLVVLLARGLGRRHAADAERRPEGHERQRSLPAQHGRDTAVQVRRDARLDPVLDVVAEPGDVPLGRVRSEEHTSELQSLMRISYAVFCLKKKNKQDNT